MAEDHLRKEPLTNEQVRIASKKHKEWAMVATDYLARPLSHLLVKYTKITPNQITWFSFLLVLVAGYFLTLGGYGNILIASLLAFGYNILDMADGIVARLQGSSSLLGQWLDGVLGFIAFPILIFCLAKGLNDQLALIVGMAAIVSYPLQFLFVHYYKSDIIKNNEKISIPGKFEWMRYLYGASFFYFFLLAAAIANQPLIVLWFWATFGNIYPLLILFSQYSTLKKNQQEKNENLLQHRP